MSRILVVDDRPADRELLRTLFKHARHEVLEAADGVEALRLAQSEKPDLIVADVLLPRIDGYELVRQLRKRPSTTGTPVIFYTASFDEREDQDLAREIGVAQVLVKPTPPEIILYTVEQTLTDKSAREALSVPVNFQQKHQQLVNDKLLASVIELEGTVERLKQSEERFRLLAENATDIVFRYRVRPTPSFEYINPAVLAITGYSLEEYHQDQELPSRIVNPETLKQLAAYFRESAGGGKPLEVPVVRKDGQKIWLDIRGRPILDSEGNLEAVEGIARDITTRKHLEQLKEDFISMVSHELRTPLTVIIGGMCTLLNESKNLSAGEAEMLVQDSLAEAESMADMVENLLELSRAQANRLTLICDLISFENLAREVADKMKGRYPSHHFVVDIPLDLPEVTADPMRLKHVLYNLLDNAAKYSPEGSKVKLAARRDTDSLVVSVTDQGIGIAPEDQARIFTSFERLNGDRTIQAGGTGLGLVVCKRLVEVHGGRIWVESEPGKGATFKFSIPLKNSR